MGIWYDKKAYALLKKSSDAKDLTAWNEYRKATNYAPINLRFTDLSDFYLQNAELQNIDLRGANLANADFYFADVDGVKILNFKLVKYLSLYFISIGFIFPMLNSEIFEYGMIDNNIAGLLVLLIIVSTIGFKYADRMEIDIDQIISNAKNPEKIIGINKNYLKNKTRSLAKEFQKEVLEIRKEIEKTQDDIEKKKLSLKLEALEKAMRLNAEREYITEKQKVRIENVIAELQSPYKYIHQTNNKIEWHNRFYYGAIVVFIGIFIYALTHGYIEQKMATFVSLFSKETLPTFGTIFGVILFYGSPVLIGISLIIYFIAQINKNIDKITELQEQERNIKQIASTIKAKAQVGMSDEEFVKETKNLIQKYQEGMMAGMFTKDKTSEKEDKSSPSTYREKMIANGMSKLLMQALKK